MFRSVFSKNLRDARARRAAIDAAVENARQAYKKQPLEQAREPILKLQDQFDQGGLDRLELLYAAESSIPGDQFWLRAIVDILQAREELGPTEASYLLRLATMEPERLDLWKRLFKELKAEEEEGGYAEAREKCALALLPFFSPTSGLRWSETITEGDAANLLSRCLAESLDLVVKGGRRDRSARTLLEAGLRFFPTREDIRGQLALLIVEDKAPATAENLQMVMEALVANPDNVDLKLWAARALTEMPRHHDEGLEMLRQLVRDWPSDARLQGEFVSALKSSDAVPPKDVEFLRDYQKGHPDDLRVLELVADEYSGRQDLSPEALKLYRAAATQSPNRRRYLRLLGKASAERGDWSEVIEIFDEVRQAGQETEEIILPLATAYAEFQRNDSDAMETYRKAIELGSRRVEVHSLYCRYLYLTKRSAPESIAQFMQTVKICPDCSWAQLGLGRHYADTGDYGRALDAALMLIAKNPKDKEAVQLGALSLAKDFSRRQLARLAEVDQKALRTLFEEAYRLQPDAGPIAMGLVRRRIADGVADEETARLLGEVCRKNPEAMDLRIARADLLWQLGQRRNAAQLYRELMERWQAQGGYQLPRGISQDIRHRMLVRVCEDLFQPPGPTAADVGIIMEAMGEPTIPEELVVAAARTLVDLDLDHPQKLALLEKATRIARGDLKIERARAELMAARGTPRPAIDLAIRLVYEGQTGEEAVNLLRSLAALITPGTLDEDAVKRLLRDMDPEVHTPALLLATTEFLTASGPPSRLELPILQKLRETFPKNIRIQHRLAQALAQAGHDEQAASEYSRLLDRRKMDDSVVLELVRTNIRLGRHTPELRQAARRAAELEPNNAEFAFHLGCVELSCSNIKEAARLFDKAIGLDDALHTRIYTFLEHNREMRTEHGELFLVMARVHIKAGQIEKALGILGQLQGEYQRYLGDLIALYGEVAAAMPDNPRPYAERAILYRVGGRMDEAIEDLRHAHRLAPDNTDLMNELADVLRQKVASQTYPDPNLALEAARMLLDLGEDMRSYEVVEGILERNPENAEALQLLARLQLNAGALQNCWRTLRRIARREEAQSLMQELARAFADQDQAMNAVDVLSEAIEAGGPQRELLEQLRHLYEGQAQASRGRLKREQMQGVLSEKAQGRYELREEIGQGAMGIVYKAYDRELDEIVCLKILPERIANDPRALALFRNEAKAARKLAHPHICRIHDIGAEDGRRHISMEFVGGGDLRDYMKAMGGTLPVEEALRIVRETAEALAHAHGEGVLHRDIKSANIMLTTSGRVKLSDFGIASIVAAVTSSQMDQSSPMVIGTPLYMSPEQFDGGALTPSSDLYSLGVLLYEMLSGRPPFTRGSIPYHHRFTTPERIPGLPDDVWFILQRLLAKDPADRVQSARELLELLSHVDLDLPPLDETQ